MSSTNRSEARQFHISDYYITPVNEIKNFFSALDNAITIDMDKCTLDPAIGGDSKNQMSYPTAIANYYSVPVENIKTIDIREDSLAETKADYLHTTLNYKPHVIITNHHLLVPLILLKRL